MKDGDYRLRCARINNRIWHVVGVDCDSKRQGKEAKEVANVLVGFAQMGERFGIGGSVPICKHCIDELAVLWAKDRRIFEQLFLPA